MQIYSNFLKFSYSKLWIHLTYPWTLKCFPWSGISSKTKPRLFYKYTNRLLFSLWFFYLYVMIFDHRSELVNYIFFLLILKCISSYTDPLFLDIIKNYIITRIFHWEGLFWPYYISFSRPNLWFSGKARYALCTDLWRLGKYTKINNPTVKSVSLTLHTHSICLH